MALLERLRTRSRRNPRCGPGRSACSQRSSTQPSPMKLCERSSTRRPSRSPLAPATASTRVPLAPMHACLSLSSATPLSAAHRTSSRMLWVTGSPLTLSRLAPRRQHAAPQLVVAPSSSRASRSAPRRASPSAAAAACCIAWLQPLSARSAAALSSNEISSASACAACSPRPKSPAA
eukprot:scaffold123815_cov48-Phaeocystis_antarctica.AAC.2